MFGASAGSSSDTAMPTEAALTKILRRPRRSDQELMGGLGRLSAKDPVRASQPER